MQSAAPGEPPFCKEGDKVSKGQTVGIIEAMKLMNEIEVRAVKSQPWHAFSGLRCSARYTSDLHQHYRAHENALCTSGSMQYSSIADLTVKGCYKCWSSSERPELTQMYARRRRCRALLSRCWPPMAPLCLPAW